MVFSRGQFFFAHLAITSICTKIVYFFTNLIFLYILYPVRNARKNVLREISTFTVYTASHYLVLNSIPALTRDGLLGVKLLCIYMMDSVHIHITRAGGGGRLQYEMPGCVC